MIEAVTLRQLRYLVALADTLHFGKAAQRCHVSQPSLSAQIQQLEDLLGAALVERTQRRVLLTATGRDAVARARAILAAMDDLGAATRAASAPLTGPVRLGVIPTLAPFFLPDVLPSLTADHPSLQLTIREDLTDRLLEALRTGRLDALLLALPVAEPGLEEEVLFEEPFYAAVPSRDPAAAAVTLTPDALAEPDLLLLDEGHCLRDQALAVCGTQRRHNGDGPPESGFAAASLFTIMELVAAGMGRTFLPALAAAKIPPGVTLRAFSDPVPGRTIGLVWRSANPRRGTWRALADALRREAPPCAPPIPHPAPITAAPITKAVTPPASSPKSR